MAEFIRIEYTGKVKDTDEVFDTTDEETAKKSNIHRADRTYGPTAVVLGGKQVLRGLEEALEKMKPGESKTVTLPPEKAFGARSPELVKLVPMKVFKDNGITPHPGLIITLEGGVPGRVQSVSGGRIRVDFNLPLAGRVLEYEVKLVSEIKDEKEKIKALFENRFPKSDPKALDVRKQESETELRLPKDCLAMPDYQARKIALIEDMKKFLKIKTVKIEEEY
jgi:peptidylprolyl isomerase